MKLKRYALAALLLAVALPAAAQSVGTWGQKPTPPQSGTNVQGTVKVGVVGGVTRSDTLWTPLQFDATGAVLEIEQYPAMDANLSLVGNTSISLAGGAADSSAVLDSHRMRLGMFLLRATPNSTGTIDTSTTIRLIVQFRIHRGAVDDSLHTFSIYQYGAAPQLSGVGTPTAPVTVASLSTAAAGTILHSAAAAGSIGNFSSIPVGSYVMGPGVAVGTTVISKGTADSAVTISLPVSQPVNAQTMTFYPNNSLADSTVVGHAYKGVPITGVLATPSAQTAWSGEFVVLVSRSRVGIGQDVAINGHTFYYPSGIAIPMSSIFGRDLYAPYISIRIRNASTTTCVINYYGIEGTPL